MPSSATPRRFASWLAAALLVVAVAASPVFTTEFRLESTHPDTASAVMQFLDAIGVTVGILNITVSTMSPV
jgi:hypothetical protein